MKPEAFNYYTVLSSQPIGGDYFIVTAKADYGAEIETRLVMSGRAEEFTAGERIEVKITKES